VASEYNFSTLQVQGVDRIIVSVPSARGDPNSSAWPENVKIDKRLIVSKHLELDQLLDLSKCAQLLPPIPSRADTTKAGPLSRRLLDQVEEAPEVASAQKASKSILRIGIMSS